MSLPYFPMYPTDFEAKTSHLTLAEDGAYNRLLRICWMTPSCTMPADEAWIMRRARAVSDHEQESVRAVLAEFFTIENGRYSNARLRREWLAANEAHERRKNAGAKGGKAKSLQAKGKTPSKAKAMPKQPEPEPEPEPIEDTSVSSSVKNRGTRLGKDFVAPQEWIDWAIGLGGNYQYWHNETEKFRDYWSAKSGKDATKLEWKATWRNWCRNAIERNPPKICERPFKASDLQLDLSQLNPDGSLKHDTKPH
jgi:uncharacterized protein YdaU (DUF1376 family)